MASKETVTKTIFPIFGILTIIFVLLKSFGIGPVATWSWWLVFLPIWGPLVIIFGFLAIFFIVALVVASMDSK